MNVFPFGYPLEPAVRQIVWRSSLIRPVNIPAFVVEDNKRATLAANGCSGCAR